MIWVLALIMIFIIVLEKYGLEQIVNLKELLSDINGMGYCTKEDKSIKIIVLFERKILLRTFS